MWSAPALGSEKEIIRIELIHALEVGLQNRCGALLMALITNQTKPPTTLAKTTNNIDQTKPPTKLAKSTLKSS